MSLDLYSIVALDFFIKIHIVKKILPLTLQKVAVDKAVVDRALHASGLGPLNKHNLPGQGEVPKNLFGDRERPKMADAVVVGLEGKNTPSLDELWECFAEYPRGISSEELLTLRITEPLIEKYVNLNVLPHSLYIQGNRGLYPPYLPWLIEWINSSGYELSAIGRSKEWQILLINLHYRWRLIQIKEENPESEIVESRRNIKLILETKEVDCLVASSLEALLESDLATPENAVDQPKIRGITFSQAQPILEAMGVSIEERSFRDYINRGLISRSNGRTEVNIRGKQVVKGLYAEEFIGLIWYIRVLLFNEPKHTLGKIAENQAWQLLLLHFEYIRGREEILEGCVADREKIEKLMLADTEERLGMILDVIETEFDHSIGLMPDEAIEHLPESGQRHVRGKKKYLGKKPPQYLNGPLLLNKEGRGGHRN